MIDVKEKVEEIKIKTKKVLETDGYHNSMVIGFSGDKGFVISVPSYNNNTKEIIFKNLTNTLRELKVDAFVYISESWLVKKKENKEIDINIPPSKHPDRIETLYISGKTKHQTYTIYIPFVRLGKRIIFEKEEIINSNEGFSIEDNLFKGVFE